jgi:succinate dehydrogenase / fumarate reductase cytochrome b subunit
MGVSNKKYLVLLNSIGAGYSFIICVVFALMPVAIYLKWVN